jgi:hypothetical protein
MREGGGDTPGENAHNRKHPSGFGGCDHSRLLTSPYTELSAISRRLRATVPW